MVSNPSGVDRDWTSDTTGSRRDGNPWLRYFKDLLAVLEPSNTHCSTALRHYLTCDKTSPDGAKEGSRGRRESSSKPPEPTPQICRRREATLMRALVQPTAEWQDFHGGAFQGSIIVKWRCNNRLSKSLSKTIWPVHRPPSTVHRLPSTAYRVSANRRLNHPASRGENRLKRVPHLPARQFHRDPVGELAGRQRSERGPPAPGPSLH